MKIHKAKVYRYANKTMVDIKLEIECEEDTKWAIDTWKDVGEYQAKLNTTLPWLGKHLLTWADFDQHYTIDLFCDSLQKLGEGLIRWNNAMHALRTGRRAIYAAHLLRNAYEDVMFNDVCIRKHHKRCPFEFKKLRKGMSELTSTPLYDNAMNMDRKEYEEKMYRIAQNRCKKVNEEKIKYAWEYIQKWTPYLWD